MASWYTTLYTQAIDRYYDLIEDARQFCAVSDDTFCCCILTCVILLSLRAYACFRGNRAYPCVSDIKIDDSSDVFFY